MVWSICFAPVIAMAVDVEEMTERHTNMDRETYSMNMKSSYKWSFILVFINIILVIY